MSRAATALAAALALAACGRRPASEMPHPRYTVGPAYQAGGVWRYPQENPRYAATGLASVETRGPGLTADGERYEGGAMVAAHPTLQLPAIARVTDLDTGRQIEVRVNDRGPADPGRVIALTPGAAALLGIPPGGSARVRVQVEPGPSEALRDALGGAPKDAVAAPVGTVTAEALGPPGAAPSRGSARTLGEPGASPAVVAAPPDHLPATAVQVAPEPGGLWLDLGSFSGATYANAGRARLAGLGARVEREGRGQATTYRVRAGPFATARAADAALDQARRAGVSDASITAE